MVGASTAILQENVHDLKVTHEHGNGSRPNGIFIPIWHTTVSNPSSEDSYVSQRTRSTLPQ